MANILQLTVGGIIFIILAIAVLVGGIVAFFYIYPVKLWWRAKISNAPIPLSKLLAMKLKKVDLNGVVAAYITTKNAGINLSINELETHVLSGGNIDAVIKAMISARNAGINLPLQVAKAIDLAGKDVCQIVQSCIVPRVVETPLVTAVSKDGIELKAKASVTIKANIGRILGGADEGTILSRVAESLSSTIGSSINHSAVIENPDVISNCIMDKGLDVGTAYEILSIDIFDITVGKNIAVKLKLEQGEIEKKKNQAKLEERRLEAVALEQENKAKLQEAKIRATEAEADVPRALAEALKEGKISPVDYYDIKNLEADTKLRSVLSGDAKPTGNGTSGGPPRPMPAVKRKNPFDF